MDLYTLAARLTLDSGEYARGLEGASSALSGFAARLALDLDAAGARTRTSMGALSAAAPEWGRDMMQGFIDGIRQKWSDLTGAVKGVAGTVKRYLGFSEPEEGPLSDFHTYAPDMMRLFAEGIRENADLVNRAVGESFDLAPRIKRAAGAEGPEFVAAGGGDGRGGVTQVIFEIDGLQRLVYTLNQAETQRVGVRLAGGGL